ncbi:hypothetical protein KKC49_00710 [Patescibacteria group bacterium]|nr:hypothetical protein [Patescibacteria group bacterium]
MTNSCEQIKTEYENLKTLKEEFDLEYQKAVETGELERVREMRTELEEKRDALKEKLWLFEGLPQKELKEQYESQREILKNVGILEKLTNGEIGIKGIDNKEYPFPSYQEISKRIRENKEMLKTKVEQGFNQLLIVPFGMKLDDLIEKYKEVILKHHQEGKLLATKENPSDPDEPMELNEDKPVWVWDKYNNADISGEIVYFPNEFSKVNHQGKTKQEILKEKGGWNILFIEDLPNIPRKDKGKEIKSRKQLESGQSPNEYLETLKTNPIYQNETGMTPEEQIVYALKHLEQTNQVIDDYSGKGSASYQLGAFFPADGYVPDAYWYRGTRQVYLDRYTPEGSYSNDGVRGAVRGF